MKIVGSSNFCLFHVSDFLVCENVYEGYGDLFVKFLNQISGDNGTYFFRLVDDSYKLYVWEP